MGQYQTIQEQRGRVKGLKSKEKLGCEAVEARELLEEANEGEGV